MAIVPHEDLLYVGGSFTKAGNVTVKHVAVWDGTVWSALGSGTDQTVYALAVDGEGGVYAGGNFSAVDGVAAGFVARWDGEMWDDLSGGMNQMVQSLAVDSDGSVYAGGAFTRAGNGEANYIARWDGSRWHNLGAGMDHNVFALAPVGDGTLYAGGGFMTADDKDAPQVAYWDGLRWHSLGVGIEMAWGRPVCAMALAEDGTLYAGGNFDDGGGVSASNIARWDGNRWHTVGGGVNGVVRALAFDHEGIFFAGGYFTRAGDVPARHIAQWNGRKWLALGSGTDNIVSALATNAIGTLHVGGNFGTAGSKLAPYLARLSPIEVTRSDVGPEIGALPYELRAEIYPNPISTSATISMTLPRAGLASLEVYDVLGRRRLALMAGHELAGQYEYVLDTADLPNGAYVLRVGLDDAIHIRVVTVRR